MSRTLDQETGTVDRRELAGRMLQVLPFFGAWSESIRDQQFGATTLGHRQIQILYVLRHGILGADQITPSALSTLFGIQPSVITRVLSRLEVSGLITRTMDPADARSQFIRITPAGHEISVEVERYFLKSMLESMEFLDDGELPALQESIVKLGRIAFDLENRRRETVGRGPLPLPASSLPYRPGDDI